MKNRDYKKYSQPVPVEDIAKEEELVEIAVENAEPIEISEEDQNEQVKEVVEDDHHDDFLTGEPLRVSTPEPEIKTVKCAPACDLNFRIKPDKNAAILCVLHTNDVIDVDWTETDWVAAKTANGVEGFVMRKFLDRV